MKKPTFKSLMDLGPAQMRKKLLKMLRREDDKHIVYVIKSKHAIIEQSNSYIQISSDSMDSSGYDHEQTHVRIDATGISLCFTNSFSSKKNWKPVFPFEALNEQS